MHGIYTKGNGNVLFRVVDVHFLVLFVDKFLVVVHNFYSPQQFIMCGFLPHIPYEPLISHLRHIFLLKSKMDGHKFVRVTKGNGGHTL